MFTTQLSSHYPAFYPPLHELNPEPGFVNLLCGAYLYCDGLEKTNQTVYSNAELKVEISVTYLYLAFVVFQDQRSNFKY